jgi:hypothetical protein
MQTESANLSRLQIKAIEALLKANNRAEAAALAGCSERSIYYWLADPTFSSELLKRENILRREVGLELAKNAGEVQEIILTIARTSRDERVRLRAADVYLSYLIRTQDQADIERRLSELEARANRE